jgi:hypothetical protein
MPDRIDDLVNQASAARLGRLFTMLNAAPTEVGPAGADDIWPRLRDPAVVAAYLAHVGAADLVALVLDPAPSLVRIRTTFEQAREFVARATDGETRAAAELLYQASAAAALARHGVVLGQRSMAARSALYTSLALRLTGGPFSQLFAAAAEAAARNPPPAA